ncbi:MAG: HAD family phosphatase [Prevotella sp.]|nr:HAD family phosphatase [Alistipes senegalensis]MCM1358529.1 HAD family phosphatase [Prevotella sp.]MCM1472772.1 HAD family phosphatase [Muribaculaceae bacterium]
MIKGVVFDLDGTLIDSMNVWCETDRIFLKENGVENPPEDISERVKKLTVDKSAELFIKEFRLECSVEYIIKRIEEIVQNEYFYNIPLKTGVIEVLDFLDRMSIPYGVATVTYKNLAEAVLKRHGIYNRLKFLLTVAEFPQGKKTPDMYVKCSEVMGFAPENVLIVEDSLHCIKTALSAGFMTAGIYDSFSENDKENIIKISDYYFYKISEIKSIV